MVNELTGLEDGMTHAPRAPRSLLMDRIASPRLPDGDSAVGNAEGGESHPRKGGWWRVMRLEAVADYTPGAQAGQKRAVQGTRGRTLCGHGVR